MATTTINTKSFFYCYNAKLSRFIVKNGYNYIVKAKSMKDDNVFTMFVKSEELNQLIKQFLLQKGLDENSPAHTIID